MTTRNTLACWTILGLLAFQPALAHDQLRDIEVHSKHWIHGVPLGTPVTNDLIIRDSYALSSNDQTKFADWVAYRLSPREVAGTVDLDRNWRADPFLDEAERLEPSGPDDYAGAFGDHDYQRGHLAPLASFKGSASASEVNYFSNIVPQKAALNGGPWAALEEAVRDFVRGWQTVWVVTGPLYEADMPALPEADEPHIVPSGFGKVVLAEGDGELRAAAFIMGQDVARSAPIADFISSVSEVEDRSGLTLLWRLPDAEQAVLKAAGDASWLIGE